MSLKLYKKKRDFKQTPEPAGSKIKQKGQLKFVIQKHHATALHYDFRLEAGGVLKSWAVPKGPSLDPKIKRLAMMVEDHPYDYRNFEGVIPHGNYGAGNVIIWDEGTYESAENPESSEKEILEEIKKGSIKIRVFGKKINGLWALVKIRPKNSFEKGNPWLLIKENDDFVSEKDITNKDESVISGLKVDEVNKKPKKTNLAIVTKGLKKSPIPKFIKPMLATLVDEPFDNTNFIFEIKWDGYRAIADIRKNKVNLYSRNETSFTKDYEPITSALSNLGFDAVFDGEIVVTDQDGRPKFQDLQNYTKVQEGNLVYYVFDLLFLNSFCLMDLPLKKRKEILEKILPQSEIIKYSSHIESKGVEFFKAVKKQNLEGIIAKKSDSIYQPGIRGNNWLKIKSHLRQEAVICGFTKPRGARKYFGALVLGLYKNSKLVYIGHTGSGFDQNTLVEVDSKLQKIKTKKSPFEEVPKTNAQVTWVEPKLVCEVSFAQWTNDHHMRIPIFLGLRSDKKAGDVIFEIAKEKKEELKTAEVKFSNLDKVFWPNEKYTKGDLIKYYESISEFILPYLKDRPESLRRYPNGIESEGFFQKDITNTLPSFASSYKISSDSAGHDVNYLLCQNEQTLTYMANLGCIDINPWSSRIQNIEKPDYIIFDLDPESIGFEKVVDAANEIRKVLEEIDVESHPKTSGATGIHIYVPTGGKYTYEQVKQFAQIIVNIVFEKNREYTSVVRSPSKRGGKVYLDFLQNRIGQTLASPYSVRPKPYAPVSTPLRWSEVNKKLRPEDFTIKNIHKRLDSVGDLFKPVLENGINMRKSLRRISTSFSV